MISVKRAQIMLMRCVRPLAAVQVELGDALGSVLAENVRSGIDLPSADNSAVDGFAIRFADLKKTSFKIRGVIKAGDLGRFRISQGEAIRIMTGARIPTGADTVIPKEFASVRDGRLSVRGNFQKGANVRYRGEELRKGTVVARRGALIHPGVIGTLATVGRKRISVFRKPNVSLIVTGNELVPVGRILRSGQVYDSNSWSIASALEWAGFNSIQIERVRDSEKYLRKVIARSLCSSDAIILTGGVSVGDYDFVKDILKRLSVRTIFWKVAQKPGKPMYVGKKNKTLVFGLPGNPASAFTCFYEYVYPALRKSAGCAQPFLVCVRSRLSNECRSDKTKFLFLKGTACGENGNSRVLVHQKQGSHMLTTFADANALVLISPGMCRLKKGTGVEVDLLPH